MTDEIKIALIGLITGIIGTLPAIVGYFIQRKKDRAVATNEQKRTEQAFLEKAWAMYQDNLDDVIQQLKTMREEREGLQRVVAELQIALDTERDKRRNVEAQMQNVLLSLSAYKTGLVLLITQIQEMGVEPRWQPPKDMTIT